MGPDIQFIKRALTRLKQADDYSRELGAAGSVGAGGALGYGAWKDLRKPMDVAVTYGDSVRFGAGHKEPAKEMLRVMRELQAERSGPRFNLHDVPRTSEGINPAAYKPKYDMMLSAGHGIDEHNMRALRSAKQPLWWRRPRVALGGATILQNDIGGPGYGFDSRVKGLSRHLRNAAGRLGLSDSLLSWGPDWHKEQGKPYGWAWAKAKNGLGKSIEDIYLGAGHPTLGPATLDNLRNAQTTGFQGALERALADQTLPVELRDKLRQMAGKRVIMVTGGGQGTVVAARARELMNEAASRGLNPSDFHVLAAQGDAKKFSPAAHLLQDQPGLTVLDRLPRKHFAGLSSAADVHWAIPGGSQTAEILASPNSTAFSRNVQGHVATELGMIDSMGQDAFSRHGLNPNWRDILYAKNNPGALAKVEAAGLPGIREVAHAGDVLDMFAQDRPSMVADRARSYLGLHEEASANLKNALRRLLSRQAAWRNTRGVGKAVVGAGLLAAPIAASIMPPGHKRPWD